MSQFKKFSASESQYYDSGYVGREGELTWDTSNGLRIHDGSQNGGRQIGASSYNDLSDTPTIPASLTDLISSGAGNNLQFLRYNSGIGQVEFSSDFRVVPFSNISYPNGTLGQDKAGDVAFSSGAIYYCIQEPNAYSLTWVDPAGWASGIIQLSNRGPGDVTLTLGSKLTDGTTVATVTELITGGWDGTRQVVRISPEISQWRSGTGTLTVLTSGTTANTHIWAKIGSEVVNVPAHNTSPGIVGQIAYDSNYMYRCTQSNIVEVSYVYTAPAGRNTSPYNWPNQTAPNLFRLFQRGDAVAPQVGWVTSDGSNQRTITNVFTQASGFGTIHDLTLDSTVDYSAATTITVYQTVPAAAVWKRIALSADTW